MCELFGLSCNEKDRAVRSLPVFIREGSWCHDGWGIGYYKGSKAVVERSGEDINRQEVKEKFLNLMEKNKEQNNNRARKGSHQWRTRPLQLPPLQNQSPRKRLDIRTQRKHQPKLSRETRHRIRNRLRKTVQLPNRPHGAIPILGKGDSKHLRRTKKCSEKTSRRTSSQQNQLPTIRWKQHVCVPPL